MLRGLEHRQEQDPSLLLRDTRTIGQRIDGFLNKPEYVLILLVMLAVTQFLFSAFADLTFLVTIGIFWYAYTRRQTLPFRLPQRAKAKDYNDTIPGSTKVRQGRGITFFGNEEKTNEELWFNNDDMRTHVLIFGSTGSGKTEALVSLAFNSLVQASGFIYVDGKGDNSLYGKLFSMARRMGRTDDMLLINFMTGARDVVGPQEKRLSNTMNPFADGSSSMLSQLVISLMDGASSSADGDMWKGRAIGFVEALMRVLVYARDQGYVLLDANTVRWYFSLERIEPLILQRKLLRDRQEPISLEEAPDVVIEPLYYYAENLPGFDKSKQGKQSSQVLEQHGFITMQLTRVFTSLADTYGHIIRTKLAEVDMRDVVLNRRILVVLLPALEKSPEELSNLGKVIIATLKAMMAAGLGSEVEGTYREVIERKPTTAPTPFVCILDEYGYYAVQGFAVVPAQARSLGFSVIFAGQDLPAFQKASKEEAASIGANTNIKIAMKLEDPLETWDFFSKTAGEAYVTKVDAFQTNAHSLANNYLDTRSASAEKRARIDLLDLKEQSEGQMHIFFKSKIVRANVFYANPKPVPAMKINQFLKVDKPPTRALYELAKQFENFDRIVAQGVKVKSPELTDELKRVMKLLEENAEMDPIERGVATLLAMHEEEGPSEQEPVEMVTETLNVFMQMAIPDFFASMEFTEPSRKEFNGILLNKSYVADQVAYLERLTGKPQQHAQNIASEIVKDMQQATYYPPDVIGQPQGAELADRIYALSEAIEEIKANRPADDQKNEE